MPEEWTPSEQWCFPHPFVQRDDFEDSEYVAFKALTLAELRMIKLSYALRSKPSCQTKYKNPEIRARWRDEALVQEILEGTLTEEEVDYVLDELKEYEAMKDTESGVEPSCHTRIWQSDSLIPSDLRDRLISQIAALEDVPENKKDWHPRSDNQVLDLVHPSLHSLVYGRTLAYPPLEECPVESRTSKDLSVIQGPQKFLQNEWKHQPFLPRVEPYTTSDKFAWIPTDFAISTKGETARPLGYINNLHPSHSKLYDSLSLVVARFSHLFDRVLTDLHPANSLLRRINESYGYHDDDPHQGDDEDDDAFEDRYEEWLETRSIDFPSVPTGGYKSNAGNLAKREVNYSIRGRECQIIIKLANIHLTTEKPTYPGGSWHVEGMGNERIAASGIYYYACENITDSQLAFRTATSFDLEWYEQDDSAGVNRTFGLERDGEYNQHIGSIPTFQGRCIAFPNSYQHRVSPFELVDRSKPGCRKIIALFLVDPTLGQALPDSTIPVQAKIPSTSLIPPQQADWVRDALNIDNIPPANPFHKLPLELIDTVAKQLQTHDYVVEGEEGAKAVQLGSTMSWSEAEQYRLELMDERTAFVGTHDEKFFASAFDIYEQR